MSNKGVNSMKLSEDQLNTLEENFKQSRNPEDTSLMLIAAECGLSEEEARRWFKQRNEKWREAEGLPTQPRSVLD